MQWCSSPSLQLEGFPGDTPSPTSGPCDATVLVSFPVSWTSLPKRSRRAVWGGPALGPRTQSSVFLLLSEGLVAGVMCVWTQAPCRHWMSHVCARPVADLCQQRVSKYTCRPHYARAPFSLSCPGHGESRPWGWRVCHLLGQAALTHAVPATARLSHARPARTPPRCCCLSHSRRPFQESASLHTHLRPTSQSWPGGCPGRVPVRCTHSEVPVVSVGIAALACAGCHVRQVDTGAP